MISKVISVGQYYTLITYTLLRKIEEIRSGIILIEIIRISNTETNQFLQRTFRALPALIVSTNRNTRKTEIKHRASLRKLL
jgi:hypothetical protein